MGMGRPASTVEIAAAVEGLLAERGPLSEEELLAALAGSGVEPGGNPGAMLADVLESDDLPSVLPLLDGRYAFLPALLAGRVFTHRVTEAEVEYGFVAVSPDLEPLSLVVDDPRYGRLADGAPVVDVLGGFDEDGLLAERGVPAGLVEDAAVLLLPPDRLRASGVRAGDLVGVGVGECGLLLTRVDAGAAAAAAGAAEVGPRVAEVLAGRPDEGPEQVDTAVWTVCAQDPALFGVPVPPLGELFEAAGLVCDGEQVAPAGFDLDRWQVSRRIGSVMQLHDLGEDEALAVLATVRLYHQVADLHRAAVEADRSGVDPWTVLEPAAEPTHLSAPRPHTPHPEAAPAQVADAEATDAEATVPEVADPDGAGGPGGEPALVRATLAFLAEPQVAEAVLVETMGVDRDGAAALGLLAETLEPQAPREARPALRWLRGKAHERMGAVLEAETAFEAALALDAGWPPALYDLARYAGDRGDAERGLALLRRAGAPADDALAEVLHRFRSAPRTGLGRNRPCWCGSGRKYKQCHLRREQLPLAERAGWLYLKALAYLADGPWTPEVIHLAQIRARHRPGPDALLTACEDPLVTDAVLFEGGAFEQFLSERGILLPDDERLLAGQWLLVDRSVHQVEDVRPGHGFTARDLRTGDRHEVTERAGSRQLAPGVLICARLVPVGDTTRCFGGIEPVGLHQRQDLVTLLDKGADPADLVAHLSARFAPPQLQNTEGDPLALCETTLRTPTRRA